MIVVAVVVFGAVVLEGIVVVVVDGQMHFSGSSFAVA